jgi:hypothetical protein
MAENYDNWTLNEEDDTKVIPEERCILTLSNEVMKESIEEKGIKLVDLLDCLKDVLNLLLMNLLSLFKYMLLFLLR